ncbi:E3 ubiquitin-protein ligase rfwd3.L-like [Styela clava]
MSDYDTSDDWIDWNPNGIPSTDDETDNEDIQSETSDTDSNVMLLNHERHLQRRNALPNIQDSSEIDTLDQNEENVISSGEETDHEEEEENNGEEDLLSIASNGYRSADSQLIGQTALPETTTTSRPLTPVPSTSTKRKQSSPRPNPSPKKTKESSLSQEEDGDCCPICFEHWSNSGKHRLSSLKCGHLFGQSCIERWMKGAKKCPQCNTKARKADIRVLYAKKLTAVDTTELTEATTAFEHEKKLRRNKEMELAKVQMQYQMAMTECNRLKSQLEDLKNMYASSTLPTRVSGKTNTRSRAEKKFSHIKNVLISSTGNCRVMDYHAESLSLAISQPSPHTTFMQGFGLKKFSVCDMKSSHFNILHSKPIRDVRFSPHNSFVLTASQDETLKITNWENNSSVHTYKPQKPVWSCCWDMKDSNLLYGGLSDGSIKCYDMRNTTDVLHTILNPVSRCPIVSLYNVSQTSDSETSKNGLLSQTFKNVTFWQQSTEELEYTPHYLPLQPGNCAGLQYCDNLKQCLVTFRPGQSYTCTTHILCQMEFNNSMITNVIETYNGGQCHKMLTRNSLFSTNSSNNLVCVTDEGKNLVNIYEAQSKGSLIQSLSCSGPALDILPMKINEKQLLATLTDKELKVYEQK